VILWITPFHFLEISLFGLCIGCIRENIVKKQVELLVKLQETDQTIDKLKWQMRDGPERLGELAKKVQTLEEEIATDERRVQELKQVQRQYEADIEDGIAHIRKSRGRLMSIRNNREYRALLREIEDTEKENAAKEDGVLECLEELENLNQGFEVKRRDRLVLQDGLEDEKKNIAEEVARIQEKLSHIEQDRERLIQAIDPSLLTKYQQIRTMSGGIAVSLVNHATCRECHLGIPPQMYNELQRQDTLQFCPHCHRIIYWKEVDSSV
jgi:predicted  nucleic acid-binding Zn-ribbon protein